MNLLKKLHDTALWQAAAAIKQMRSEVAQAQSDAADSQDFSNCAAEFIDRLQGRVTELTSALQLERGRIAGLQAELETERAALSDRANWRPRREMPEGCSVVAAGDDGMLEVSRPGALVVLSPRIVAEAEAAYLDAEEV